MRFEWDANKAATNFSKHGVSFSEATEVFYDPNALDEYDSGHSSNGSAVFYYWTVKPAFIVRCVCRECRRCSENYLGAKSKQSRT